MKLPYTMSGKCGLYVWQRARYGMICYPAFIPANPRSPGQIAIRHLFAAVSQRWRTLTEQQRLTWIAVAATILSKPRLYQCGPLTGCQLFVKVNVRLAHRGQPQLDLPPLSLRCPRLAVPSPVPSDRLDQLPLAPTLYLEANHLLAPWPQQAPRTTHHVPPAPT